MGGRPGGGGPRAQARIAAAIAMGFLAMPALRHSGLVQFDGFVNWVNGFAPDRASSLQFRLDNEDELLARAMEQPLFGWGGWASTRRLCWPRWPV